MSGDEKSRDRLKGLYLLGAGQRDRIYGSDVQAEIASLVDVVGPALTGDDLQEDSSLLADVDVLFSGWGAPVMDAAFLSAATRLRAVFYGAGSVRGFVTDALWDRGIVVSSANAANGVPVAEFTVSQILFSLKRGWEHVFDGRARRAWPQRLPVPGAYGSTVAVISLGAIGRLVCEMLRPFDVSVIAYDPFVAPDDAAALGVEAVGLEECFQRGDVVSLHTPNLPETRGMITGELFGMMKSPSTFINTARGAVVREDEMIDVLKRHPDLFALLDVTSPEPPEPGSPLYELPNVVLTPHIAGSMDGECHRMGRFALEEFKRYLRGEPLQSSITRGTVERLA